MAYESWGVHFKSVTIKKYTIYLIKMRLFRKLRLGLNENSVKLFLRER